MKSAPMKMRQDLSILLLEDDEDFRCQLVKLLGVYNDITEAATIAEARKHLAASAFDVVLLDKTLPDGNGLDLIPEIKQRSSKAVVIVFTGDSNFNLVQKCLDAGASDYLFKSENAVSDLLVRIPLSLRRAALERQSEQLTTLIRSAFRYEIIGRSAAMAELRSTVQSLKGSPSPVLITGESGTGKELVAQRLNAIEDQPGRPFVALNCGAIPKDLFESELFGHKKGSFTGATDDKTGSFVSADNGDLFLDEIADLPLSAQVKLLRALQEGEVTPVGSDKPIPVSVRIIAATNKSLEELVSEGKFREDLYFRLNVFRIATTPLRDRPEDIPDLVSFFLTQFGEPNLSASEDALKYLSRQQWPGNIRELRNSIERALLYLRRRGGTVIEKSDVLLRAGTSLSVARALSLPKSLSDVSAASYQEFMKRNEREYVQSVLELCGYNVSTAAVHLGVNRATLYRRMTELGLHKKTRDIRPQSNKEGSELHYDA